MRLIKIIFTAAVALAATIASAQGLKVTAELDSTVTTQGYCTDLRSMTGGRGEPAYAFVRYEQAPSDVQEKEIAARAASVA